jgi:hypothetical protein
MPDVEIKYAKVNFSGSLLKENDYRKDGGTEVDAAWEALGVDCSSSVILSILQMLGSGVNAYFLTDRAAIVPTSLAAKSGLTEDQVQVSPKYGGGFPANVEGLHHLHCLNLLRKSLYFNFEHYHALGEGSFKNDDRILKFHVSEYNSFLQYPLKSSSISPFLHP